MNNLDQITLGDIGRALARYRPMIAVVAAILLITAFLPGARETNVGTADFAAPDDAGFEGSNSDFDPDDGVGGASPDGSVPDGSDFDAGSGGDSVTTGGGGSGGTSGSTGGSQVAGPQVQAQSQGGGQQLVANCDPNTGRVKVPSIYAAPCVPAHTGGNTASYRGVTPDKIKVIWYEVREDAATSSVLAAAGANDPIEARRAQVKDWIAFYSAHFNTWGRTVEVEFLPASGETTDDAAARADAIAAAEKGAFAVMNAPTSNVFVDELKARGVMCMCTVSQPIENYLEWAPFVWSTLASSTQLYLHRAAYVGRLKGGKAKWSQDPTGQMQTKDRKYGLLYYDTDDKAYLPGIQYFERTLKENYGITLAAKSEYHGYPETARSQEDARPAIQRLVQAGVTTVICACDPFGPIFMTQEATRQLFYPEWIVTGSALTDTSFFARLYDQDQWSGAFGVSALAARLPEEFSDSYRLLKWHFGREPSAPSSYGVIRGPIDLLMNGIHMAGPKLDPGTFRDGMWRMPPTAMQAITGVGQSFGRHGIWPWDDYLAFDNMTEIWWDRNAEGEDEIGGDGRGLYRYVDGGVRYLPKEWPKSAPRVFDTKNTVTIYDKPPAADQWPEYPPPKR